MDLTGCLKLIPNANDQMRESLYGFDRFYQSLKASIKSSRETRACLAELVDAYYMFSRRVAQIAARLTRANQVNCLSGTVQSTWQHVADAALNDAMLHEAFANEINTSVVQPFTELIQEMVGSYKPIKREVTRANATYEDVLTAQLSEKKEAFLLAKRYYEAAATHQASPRVEAAMRKREAHYVESCCETERARAAYYLTVQQAIYRIDRLQERRANALRVGADKFDNALAARIDRMPAIRVQLRAAVDRIDVRNDIDKLRNLASTIRRAPFDRSVSRRADNEQNEEDGNNDGNGAADSYLSSKPGEDSELRPVDTTLDGILEECNTQYLVEFYAEDENNVVYGDAHLREAALARKRDELRVEVERFIREANTLRTQFISYYGTAQAQTDLQRDTSAARDTKTIGLIRRTPSGRFVADDGDLKVVDIRGINSGITPLQRDHARQQVVVVVRRWFEVESVLLMLTASLWKLESPHSSEPPAPNPASGNNVDALRPVASAAAFGVSTLPQFVTKQRDANGLWQTVLRLPMRVFVSHLPTEIGIVFRHDSLLADAAATTAADSRFQRNKSTLLRDAATLISTARASFRSRTQRSMRARGRSAPPKHANVYASTESGNAAAQPMITANLNEFSDQETYANVPFKAAVARVTKVEVTEKRSTTVSVTQSIALAAEDTDHSDADDSEPYQNVLISAHRFVDAKPKYAEPRSTVAAVQPIGTNIPFVEKSNFKHGDAALQNKPELEPATEGEARGPARSGSVDSIEEQIMRGADQHAGRESSADVESFFTDDEVEEPVNDDEKLKSKRVEELQTEVSEEVALPQRAVVITSTPKRGENHQDSETNESSRSRTDTSTAVPASASVSATASQQPQADTSIAASMSVSASVSVAGSQQQSYQDSSLQQAAETSQRSNVSANSASRPAAPPRPKEIPAHVRAQMERKNATALSAKRGSTSTSSNSNTKRIVADSSVARKDGPGKFD